MKSYVEIKKKGFELDKKLSHKIIKDILYERRVENNIDKYSIWGFPKDKPKFWYVITGDIRKRVFADLSSKIVNKYLSQNFCEAI